MWTKYNHAEILKFLKDGEGYRIGSVEPLLFCRMLAKIAHGFAAAEIGLCNFMPLLPDLILGRSYAPTHWIGGPGRINEADAKGGHKLQLEMMRSVSGRVYHSVNVRLFCPFATPDYHIVVGERR